MTARAVAPETLLQAAAILDRRLARDDGPDLGSAGLDHLASLYGPSLGLPLLRAALFRVTEDPDARLRHRRLALEGLEPLRRRLGRRAPETGDEPSVGVGGFHGLGAAVYVLTVVGQLTGEGELWEDAVAAARRVTPERLDGDRSLDLVSGAAGALLSLLALVETLEGAGEAVPDELLDRARGAGRRLLSARREPPGGGPRGWGVDDRRGRSLQTGLAHGAAGIALALVRLHTRTGEPELLAAALEGMTFERSLYLPERRRWLPFWTRSQEGVHLMSAWCRGGPGIGLARVACLEALAGGPGAPEEPPSDRAELVQDSRLALAATLEQAATVEDHLCCGNLGRAEVLARSAAGLERLDPGPAVAALRRAADRTALDVLRRAKGRGDFGWSARREGAASPGPMDRSFAKGAAGVAFALVRLARPGDLPFPLLLEPVRGRP